MSENLMFLMSGAALVLVNAPIIVMSVRAGASKVVVLEHVLDPQVLDCDEGVAVNVRPGDLVRVILALARFELSEEQVAEIIEIERMDGIAICRSRV